VRGGVQRQGLFRLPPDSRVADLIMKAGGATAEADLSEINLAAKLMDGTTLTVPVGARLVNEDGRISGRGGQHHAAANPSVYLAGTAAPEATEPTPGRSVSAAARQAVPAEAADTAVSAAKSKSGTAAGGGLVNLNTATQAELESLPGIGAVLAGRIVEQRQAQPFTSVEELDNISGIGTKKLEAVRNLVTVE
jgi:competence protein ComEA